MDADLQDSPDEIPELHRMITEDGFDMFQVGSRNDTIQSRKQFLQNYIIGLPVRLLEFICMTSTVD